MAQQVSAQGRVAGGFEWLIRHRLAVFTVVAILIGVSAGYIKAYGDDVFFLTAGRQLALGHLDKVFNNPSVQMGPVYLALAGLASVVSSALGLDERIVFAGAAAGLVMPLLFAVARRLIPLLAPSCDDRALHVREVVVAAVVTLGGPLFITATFGHYEDLIVVLGITWAALVASQGRAVSAGALLGLTASVKLWALLAVVVIMILPVLIKRVRAIFAMVAILAVVYLPFLATGEVATFKYHWIVYTTSPTAAFIAPLTFLGWSFRVGQGVIVVAVSAFALVALRGAPTWRIWSVPTAIVAARLLTDPQMLVYYWTPALTLIALGLCVRPAAVRGGTVNPALIIVPLATVAITIQQLLQPASLPVERALAFGNGVGSVALIAAAIVIGRSNRQAADPGLLPMRGVELERVSA